METSRVLLQEVVEKMRLATSLIGKDLDEALNASGVTTTDICEQLLHLARYEEKIEVKLTKRDTISFKMTSLELFFVVEYAYVIFRPLLAAMAGVVSRVKYSGVGGRVNYYGFKTIMSYTEGESATVRLAIETNNTPGSPFYLKITRMANSKKGLIQILGQKGLINKQQAKDAIAYAKSQQCSLKEALIVVGVAEQTINFSDE